VRGRLFHGLHQTFDEVAALAGENLDELAERIATLGGTAHGTVRDAAKNSRLSNYTADPADELGRVNGLADQMATSAAAVRADIETTAALGDPGTADLLTEISQALDKGLWLLEAHLTEPSAQG
jgi:starvation-inducible DNA-binding protein